MAIYPFESGVMEKENIERLQGTAALDDKKEKMLESFFFFFQPFASTGMEVTETLITQLQTANQLTG